MSFLDDVKARLNIVDVVSNYVPLQQAGRVFKARCPFHTERTPSFVVDPERGSWHCFGACSEGGDAIRFVMKIENQPFSEALRTLAARVGVPVPTPRQQAQMDPLLRANEEAMRFFQRRLQSPEGEDALAYLQERGVTPETAAAFGLGLAPDGREELKTHLMGQGFTEEQLQRAGLVTRPQQGGSRDLFQSRLMFPIKNSDGKVVGFGGRELDGSVPKYLNTPQTSIFDKSALLWGLDVAKESIQLRGEGVIVEGYMDALMAHQHGYTNAVASMGTALTARQVAALTGLDGRPERDRLAQPLRFVLALDPDAAGQDATMRSLKTSWAKVPDVRIALLPEGKDPDELIREAPDRWPEALEAAEPRVDFGFRVLEARVDLDTPQGRRLLTDELAEWVLSVQEGPDQDRYIERMELLVGLTRPQLISVLELRARELRAGRASTQRRARESQQPSAGPVQTPAALFQQGDPVETFPLTLLMRHPDLRGSASSLRPEFFHRSENREVFQKWAECSTIEEMKVDLDVLLQEHVDGLLTLERPDIDFLDHKQRSDSLSQSIRELEKRFLREQNILLGASLAKAMEEGRDTADEEEQLHEHNTRRRELDAARPRRDI